MRNIFNWLLVSNRESHVFVGTVIYFSFFVLYAILKAAFNLPMSCETEEGLAKIVAVIAFFGVLLCMFSVEYIQSKFKVKPDILDVAAGVLVPFLVMLFLMFV